MEKQRQIDEKTIKFIEEQKLEQTKRQLERNLQELQEHVKSIAPRQKPVEESKQIPNKQIELVEFPVSSKETE